MRHKQRVKNVIVYAALVLLATALLGGLYILSSTPRQTTKLTTPALGLGLDVQETQLLELKLNSLAGNYITSDNLDIWSLTGIFPGLVGLAGYDQIVVGADIYFTLKGAPGLTFQLTGTLLSNAGGLTYKGEGTLTSGGIVLPTQVLVINADLYVLLGESDRELLTETQQIALDFAVGNWLHLDTSKYLDPLQSTFAVSFEIPQDRIDELQKLWQQEHIFVVTQADNYVVDQQELVCALANLNASAFPDLNMSDRTLTITLCAKSSDEIPVYLNISQTWGSINGWELGLGIYPTEGVLEEFVAPEQYKELGEIIDFVY